MSHIFKAASRSKAVQSTVCATKIFSVNTRLSETAVIYPFQFLDRAKALSLEGRGKYLTTEQKHALEALAARVCDKCGISRETIHSIIEAQFGAGGIACLYACDYQGVVHYLANL